MSESSQRRMLLALVAASTAVGICLLEHHFTLEPNWPSVVESTRHKCGKLLGLMLCWLVAELAAGAWRTLRRPLDGLVKGAV